MSSPKGALALDTPLLSTKIHIPPVRSELVPRPRLIDRLSAGLDRKLTLISAPAGFGKTTLVSAWVHSTDRPVTWISLDEGDNDVVRFLNYLVAAFRQIDGGIGEVVHHLLEAPQLPPVEALLTELINDVVTRSLPLVLVLDAYHAITELGVHAAVDFLLERQPPQMHVVIISCQDPPVSLSRLRGRGQVTEVRQSDLRFTLEEAATFLNQAMGLNLEAPSIAALDAHTEGWIAGLQMAAFALQSRIADGGSDSVPRFIDAFSGRHHFILDYLTDEVLRHQPEPIHKFLLRTSILERMCASLCDALVGEAGENDSRFTSSRQILEHLQQTNLFVVPLDDERQWYRYHHLFADLLRVHLQETEADQVAQLHLRAATWYDENTLPAEAVHHALAIPDFDLAAEVIERATLKPTSWSSVSVALFLEWLRVLPDDVVRARPRLWLFSSRVFYLAGQREDAERILREVTDSLHDDPSAPDAERLLGLVVADRASYAAVRGDVRQAIEFAHQALSYWPEDDATMRMRVSAILGLAHFRAGNMSASGQAFSQAIASAKAVRLDFAAAPLLCNLAEVQIVQGRLGEARQTCQRAMEMASVEGVSTSMAGLAGLELGKIELAARWVADYGQLGKTEYLREFEDLTLARVLLAEGKPSRALAVLDRLLPPAEEAGRMGTVIEILALRALALQALGGADRALEALKAALQLAEPEGYARVFIDEGESMAVLLRQAARRHIAPGYVSQLLAALGTEGQRTVDMASLVEPLSDREIIVLDLLAEGLTNPEIAHRLFIALPTVKSHTRNIYGKLGVHSRKEAVVQARALGILSS